MVKEKFYLNRIKLKNKIFINEDKIKVTYGQLDKLIKDVIDTIREISENVLIIQSNSSIGEVVGFLGVIESNNIPIIIHPEINDLSFLGEFKILNKLIIMEDIEIRLYIGELNSKKEKEILKKIFIKRNKMESFGVISSGTTGMPKIILRSSESWSKAFKYQNQIFSLSKDTKCFLVGSLSFSANLNMVMNILALGGSIYTTKGFMPKGWLNYIENIKANTILLVPSRYRILLRNLVEPLDYIKSIISCGEKLSHELFIELEKIFFNSNIIEYYGSSETSFISYNDKNSFLINHNGVGRLFPNVKLFIDKNDMKITTPYAAYGVASGFLLSDYGYIDENQILVLDGRRNDIINTGGSKVNLRKIKSILEKSNLFEEFLILRINSQVKGEELVVVGVKKAGNLTRKKIINKLSCELIKSEIPKIIIKDEMPRNLNGKIDIKNLDIN